MVIHWLRQKGILYFVRLSLMIVLTSFNFWLAVIRWGWSDVDPVIKTSALIVAGATEIGLFAFLVLFHLGFYTPTRRGRALIGWALASLACVGVSLYVNIGYFSLNWHDQAGNTLADLLIRALFPMGLLLFFAMIPPKVQRFRTTQEVEREYEGKLAEARYKQQLADISRQAEHTQRSEREQRRAQLEAERATRLQMLRLAGDALRADYTALDEDGYQQVDFLGLEVELRARHLWPPSIAELPAEKDLIAAARAPEDDEEQEASDPNMEATTADGQPKWWTAEYIAGRYGVQVEQVRLRMKANYRGRFVKIPSRWIVVSGKKVRKAYYKRVQAIMADDNVQAEMSPSVQEEMSVTV